MYLRFTTTTVDEDSHRMRGLFQVALLLLDSGDLSADEWKQLRGILDWFDENLDAPKKFYALRAIFWFRADAHECITKVWEMVHLLRGHDCNIVVHKCRHLGNITYRDKLQVAAYPSPLDDRIIQS